MGCLPTDQIYMNPLDNVWQFSWCLKPRCRSPHPYTPNKSRSKNPRKIEPQSDSPIYSVGFPQEDQMQSNMPRWIRYIHSLSKWSYQTHFSRYYLLEWRACWICFGSSEMMQLFRRRLHHREVNMSWINYPFQLRSQLVISFFAPLVTPAKLSEAHQDWIPMGEFSLVRRDRTW